MNYLAHLFLADDSAESMVGAMLGDFVKGSLRDRYSEGVRHGIELHRKVDSFTDSHEIVRQSKSRISPARRRFAGIIIDVFYDHFLAKNWSDYSSVSLDDFAKQAYSAMLANQQILPEGLQQTLPFMVEQNWLCSYKDFNVIDKVLKRMSQRIRRENSLDGAAEELLDNYREFESEFRTFFPDLIDYTDSHKKESKDLLLIRI